MSALRQTETAFNTPYMLESRSLNRLIDFLFLSPAQVMPSERAFAENLLLRNFEALPVKALERLSQRLAASQGIAPNLTLKLAKSSRIEVSGPLLRKGDLSDIDIAEITHMGTLEERMAIASRHKLSSIITKLLVEIAEDDVVRAVLLNPGAFLSGKTLSDLVLRAKSDPKIQNALLVRDEITPTVAMDLFWYVPAEVREYIVLTYLCDQHSLQRLLQDDVAWQQEQKTLRPAVISDELIKTIAKHLVNSEIEVAIDMLSVKANIAQSTARQILGDKGGEAFSITAKAMGVSRAGLNDALMRLINAKSCTIIGSTDRLEPLRNLFERMSRGQALVALQYWNLAQVTHKDR